MRPGRKLAGLVTALALVAACGPSGTSAAPPVDAATTADAGKPMCEFHSGATAGNLVHLVYLVPSDREPDPAHIATLERAVRHVQRFYASQERDGHTFLLRDPIVDVVELPHEAAYYGEHDSGGDEAGWFWDNVTADAFAVTGGDFNDATQRWLFYINADEACGQSGGLAGSGVALFPANDLRGLLNQPRIPPCGDEPDDYTRCRWVGGMAYLLGITLGLHAPSGCDDTDDATPCPDNELMRSGLWTYDDAFLGDENLDRLAQSPFFRQVDLAACPLNCENP
jgi:hypothetical protein